MPTRASLVGFIVLLSACDFGSLESCNKEDTEQGTDEVTQQARALWKFYESGSDDTVKLAIDDIDGVVARAGALPLMVKIGDLTKEDLALVGKTTDPTAAQGMLLVDDLDCTLDQVTKIVAAKNQAELYPGGYDAYARNYVTPVQDFLTGKSNAVAWKTDYTTTGSGITMELAFTGGARSVPNANPRAGAVLLARSVLDAPGKLIMGSDADYKQEYVIELYFETEPKKVRHFWALWRESSFSGLSSHSDLYVNLALGAFRDIDIHTSKVCRDGVPVATFE